MSATKKKTPLEWYNEPTDETTPESVRLLNEYYGSAQTGLDENRRLAQEKNNVAYQTAQKYLGQQNKMNGLSGLGVSQSASVDMLNRYMTRQGSIDASHATASNDLFKNYLTERNTAVGEAQKKAYDDAVAIMEEGKYNSIPELEKYLNSIKGKVNDEQWASLNQLLNYEAFNPLRAQERYENDLLARQLEAQGVPGFEGYSGTDAETSGTSEPASVASDSTSLNATPTASKDGKTTVVYVKTNDGEKRSLSVGDKVTDANVIEAAKQAGNRQLFSVNGVLYYAEDDSVYKIINDNKEIYQSVLNDVNKQKTPIVNTANLVNPQGAVAAVGKNAADILAKYGVPAWLAKYLVNSGTIGITGHGKN